MAAPDIKTKQVKDIVKARKGGAKWSEIAEEAEVTVGRAIFLHECATVPEDDVVDPEATEATIRKAILRMRDKQDLSWGQISARLGRGAIGEGRVRTIYFDAGGETDNVKRGGRYANGKGRTDVRPDLDEDSPKPKKAAAKKGAPKKAAAKKSAAKGQGKSIADMSAAELKKAMMNKFVHTTDGDKFKAVSVSESNGMFEITDAEGDEWGLEQGDIAKITAR